nr:hypothetical protein [Tanacetum cinerariifolium]
MPPLTFADTHNMVTYLSKSDASEGFDQIIDFLNAHTSQYALVVNPTIYVSCIKQFWAPAKVKKCLSAKRTTWNEFSCYMASVVICLATGGCIQTEGKIEAIDADKDITLVDVEKDEEVVTKGAKPQGRINQEDVNAASKGVNAIEPTVFDDEESAVAEQVQERHLDNIRKYQSLKKKPISVAQAKNNMIIYLKNMAGYKIEHFRGMTYDKVRPIFKREDKKVQTLFKPDKDVEEPKKKRVADELKRWFKLDADDVLRKLQRYMHAPLAWKLYSDCGVHHVSSTRGHDIFMLIEKDYPLLNGVMILMLSGKLQVEEDNEMAIDLVMKIFMEANKPKSRSLDTSFK